MSEPLDLADYRQRLLDRTDDYELRLDGARVSLEIEGLRARIEGLEQTNEDLLAALEDALAELHAHFGCDPLCIEMRHAAIAKATQGEET